MDDITWRTKLAERGQCRRSQDLLIIIAVFTLALGIWAWYFFFYARTPEYALHQIESGIEKHDTAQVQKYMNMDVFTGKAYDDLTADLFAFDKTLTPDSKSLFEKFYTLVKPTMTKGMQQTMEEYIQNGSWIIPAGDGLLKGQQLGIDFDEFIERSQIRHTKLKKIGEVKKEGHFATAAIDVQEEYTQTNFTLFVQLEESSSGHWQVTYIKNYQEFLALISQLQNTDIALYTASTKKLVDDYNNLFLQQQAAFKKLTARSGNTLTDPQRKKIRAYIEDEIIPSIQGRDNRLKGLEVPAGAQHLHELRLTTDDLSIQSWQAFAEGIGEKDMDKIEKSESLHKRSLEVDQKVSDIIKHTAIARSIPNIP